MLLLNKFNSEQAQFIDWLNQIEHSINEIDAVYRENGYDLNRLKQCDAESKSIESSLFSHQADLRFMKITYQTYSQLCESFSKELKQFNSKLKDNKLKRLSTDLISDLNLTKESLLDIDNQYALKCEKFHQIKEAIRSLIDSQKDFNAQTSRFNAWLTDMELNVNAELSVAPTTQQPISESVKHLDEQLNKFKAFKTVILAEHAACYEIKRSLNAIFTKLDQDHAASHDDSLSQTANSLFSRLETLEKQVSSHYDRLADQIIRTRDLKDSLDSTTVWLNEIDNVYLNSRLEVLSVNNNNRLIVKDDQFDLYDRLLSDLNGRRQMLLDKLLADSTSSANDSTSQQVIDQLLDRLDTIAFHIQSSAIKAKGLQDLMNKFNLNYEKQTAFIRVALTQLEQIDRNQHKNIKQPESILDCVKQLEAFKSDVKQNNQVDSLLRPCLGQIQTEYCPELISNEKLLLLDQDANELAKGFTDISQQCDLKMDELNQIHDYTLEYNDLKDSLEKWLRQSELNTLKYEPIGVDVECVNHQLHQLQMSLSEHEGKASDLNELNRCANVYANLLAKYEPKPVSIPPPPISKPQNTKAKRYQRSNTSSSNLKDIDAESQESKLISSENEITTELNKLNQLYEWLGERMEQRRKELVDSINKMKAYLNELDSIDSELKNFETELNTLFDENVTHTHMNDIKLVSKNGSNQRTSLAKMDTSLTKLNANLDSLRKKGHQLVFDRETNDVAGKEDIKKQLDRIAEKYSHLNSVHSELKEKLDKFLLNLATFEQNAATLNHNLEQKDKMLTILNTENYSQSQDHTNDLLIDTQIKQIDLLQSDLFDQDFTLLDALNRSGEYLMDSVADSKLFASQLTQINSDYDLLSNKLKQTLQFKNKLKQMCTQFSDQRQKLNAQLVEIEQGLNGLQNAISAELISKQKAEKTIIELDSIESIQLVDCERMLDEAKYQSSQIIDLIRGNLAVNDPSSVSSSILSTTEKDEATTQMADSIESTRQSVNNVRQKYTDLCRDYERQEKEQEEAKSSEELMKILNELQSQIAVCNAEILKTQQNLEAKTKQSPIAAAHSSSYNVSTATTLKAEHEKYANESLSLIQTDLDFVNMKCKEFFALKKQQQNNNSEHQSHLTSLELQLDKLNANFKKLDSKFTERTQQLDDVLFKATKFEDKLSIVKERLEATEAKLAELNKTKFDFENLSEIDTQLNDCDALIERMNESAPEMDEFKEICEQLMENCEQTADRNLIEKRMDSLVHQWNLLIRSLDERKSNLEFLNLHLKQLCSAYLNAKTFVNDLNLKFTSDLVLNCIEPIVIKSQLEQMRELSDVLEKNYVLLINDLKMDTSNLLTIHLARNQEENKLVNYLPKTISIQALLALNGMLNKSTIEDTVNQIEFKYTDYKFQLDANLELMLRLYPLCEKFSQTIAQLNQAVRKYESELTWLAASNDNESSEQEKEELLNELRKNVSQMTAVLVGVEENLSTRIMDELMSAQSSVECSEFMADLNENIGLVKQNYEKFNHELDTFEAEFKARQEKLKELLGEMNDLLEWLDEVEAKSAQPEPVSFESDVLITQINEQKALSDEINKQKMNLKELTDKTKQLVRAKSIEDSIELKEKLNGLHVQSQSLCATSTLRLNELEQALAISQAFQEAYNSILSWFEEIKQDLARADHKDSEKEPKEAIKSELNLLKNIDRSLQEKKVDFETLNKNGMSLARLCNKNNNGKYFLLICILL